MWPFSFLIIRLRVCNPCGGGLSGSVPDPRCDRAKPSQQEVLVSFPALSPLRLWARHAPGPASVLRGWPWVHGADGQLGRHHHRTGRCRVSQLPLSGIHPEPVGLLGSHINLFRTGEYQPLTSGTASVISKTPFMFYLNHTLFCFNRLHAFTYWRKPV